MMELDGHLVPSVGQPFPSAVFAVIAAIIDIFTLMEGVMRRDHDGYATHVWSDVDSTTDLCWPLS